MTGAITATIDAITATTEAIAADGTTTAGGIIAGGTADGVSIGATAAAIVGAISETDHTIGGAALAAPPTRRYKDRLACLSTTLHWMNCEAA